MKKVKISVENGAAALKKCAGCTGCTNVEKSLNSPLVKVIPGISPRHEHGVEYDHADLLIITKVEGLDLGPGPMAFDAHHGGEISRAIKANNFRGAAGEHLTIEFAPEEKGGRPRYVVVVGIGAAEDVGRRRVCALFNYALTMACQLEARSLIIPIFPYRSSAGVLNLKGTAAVLRCLLAERVKRGSLGHLEEVRLLSTPQAKSHLETGLAVEHTLCSHCRIPKLV